MSAGPEIDALAILVVYQLPSDDDLPILDLHLERIARHTDVPYVVYAAANRASEAAVERLDAADHVEIVELAPSDARGSREHAHYLDLLLAHARSNARSHVVTLDVDSFPIVDGWAGRLARAADASGVAAVMRAENGDSALPHPSCTFLTSDFVERVEPSFSPDSDRTPDFRRFLRSTGQCGDTGLRLAYALWSCDVHWVKLLRSNARELHPVIGGIYDDLVFHLGATASGTVFRRDLRASPVHTYTQPVTRVPLPRNLAKARRRAVERLRAPSDTAIRAGNRGAFEAVRSWLLADPDELFAFLRGEGDTAEYPPERALALGPLRVPNV